MDPEHTLVEMVEINSADEKTEIISYMEDLFDEMGISYRVFDGESPSMLAEHGKNGIVFSGHLDTVPVGEHWTVAQGSVADGRIYGRGACDMKGGIVASLCAAERLMDEEIPFSIALTTDEETVMKGAETLSKKVQGNYCVVCEPTDLRFSTEEKGILQILLRYYGRSAHSAMLWRGENAIFRALEAVREVQSFENDPNGVTVNLGTIRGGKKPNVVPDRVDMEIDIRFPPRYSCEEIRTIFSFKADHEEVTHYLKPLVLTPPEEFLEIVPETTMSHFATEAVRFHTHIPTVILGPGDPYMAHQADEYILKRDIETAARIYEKLATVSR